MAPLAFVDRVTPVALGPGASLRVRGVITTSFDGTSFDAVSSWNAARAGGLPVPGGLFDLTAGGLRVAARLGDHDYTVFSSGQIGAACAAEGVASPCLVPRVAEIAHARLRTAHELESTLSGAVTVQPIAPEATWASRIAEAMPEALAALFVLFAAACVASRLRARTALGRVRTAAREAMRAMRGDVTMDAVRTQLHDMVARATELERARRVCARTLREAIARARGAAASPLAEAAALPAGAPRRAPTAVDPRALERAETERIEDDLAATLLGLERIECALRVVALRAREHRGVKARLARADPVDGVVHALEARDEALVEAESALSVRAATRPSPPPRSPSR